MLELRSRRRANLAGVGRLYVFLMRYDGRKLALWVASVTLLAVLGAVGVQSLYSTPAERAGYQEYARTSAVARAINGVGYALDTAGGIFVLEVGKYIFLGVALLNLVWVVGHTRASEELGRMELVRSGRVGSAGPLAAAALTALTFNAVLGVAVTVALHFSGFAWAGSAVYGVELFVVGVFFAGVAMLLSQLFVSARAAFGWGVAVLAVSFLLRAAGDVSGGLTARLSPLGWVQKGAAFGENTLIPPLVPIAATAALAVVSLGIAVRRDLGAGLVSRTDGNPEASDRLNGPMALTFYLQRSFMSAWICALFLVALGFGSVGRQVEDALESSRTANDLLLSFGPGVDAYFAMATLMLVFAAAGFALAIVARSARDESTGVAELLLSTTIGRTQWMVSTLVVAVTAAVGAHVALGMGLGLSRAFTLGEPGPIGGLLTASLQFLPASIALVSAGVLAHGFAPNWVAVVWALFSVFIVFGLMGRPLKIPQWLLNLSPFQHPRNYPDTSLPPALVPIVLVAAVLAGFGLVRFNRRDLA